MFYLVLISGYSLHPSQTTVLPSLLALLCFRASVSLGVCNCDCPLVSSLGVGPAVCQPLQSDSCTPFQSSSCGSALWPRTGLPVIEPFSFLNVPCSQVFPSGDILSNSILPPFQTLCLWLNLKNLLCESFSSSSLSLLPLQWITF